MKYRWMNFIVVAMLAFGGSSLVADQLKPIHQWSFDSDHVEGKTIKPVHGDLSGTTIKPAEIKKIGKASAMRLDGADTVVLAADGSKLPLPTKAITLEAWVRVNAQAKLPEWGGFITMIQDNGDYERGALLGFHKQKICLAIASEKTKRLTYLNCQSAIEYDKWYHIVGTYDGKEMRVYLNGQLENKSDAQQGPILYAPKFFVELGAYHDDNEYYRHAGYLHEVAVFDQAVSEEFVAARFAAKQGWFPKPGELVDGPYVELLDRTTVSIRYETDEACPTVIEFSPKGGKSNVITSKQSVTQHSAILRDVQRDSEHEFQIQLRGEDGGRALTETFKFDTTFFYKLPPKPTVKSPFAKDQWTDAITAYAKAALVVAKRTQGYCLIAGCGDGRLAYEIAMRSDMQVVAVDDNPERIAKVRRMLDEVGLYGVRVSVHHAKLSDLPYGPYFANLILSQSALQTGQPPASAASLKRMLQPSGGVLMLGSESATENDLKTWAKSLQGAKVSETDALNLVTYRRPTLENSGVWTHQYGEPDNSSNSKDDLVKGPMEVLWWGKPGPRPMPDRGARNPAPLSANGLLYVQGDRILFGLDAYNGTILWSHQLPMMRRTNIPRDSSNMVANDDGLFVSIGGDVIHFDGHTGKQLHKFSVPVTDRKAAGQHDWGYLAVIDNLLIGSTNKKRAGYRGDVGEWYEDFKPGQIDRVTSSELFTIPVSKDAAANGKAEGWRYDKGVVLNSTITIADGKLFFVESRNPAAVDKAGQRLIEEIKKDQYLVALDLKTGSKIWDKPVDLNECEFMVYLSYAQQTLLVTGSDRKTFHMYAFDAGAGSPLWDRHDKAKKNHHSGHLQHPVHIRDKIYVNQHIISLREGKTLRSNIAERRGCGTMSASNGSLFYRHHFQGMWDLESDQRSEFKGIRSTCWLSIIPAGGVVLAPESSSGCSCTHAIQTSVAYVPIQREEKKESE